MTQRSSHPPFHPDGSPCHCQALTYQSAMALAREHVTDHMIYAGRVRWNGGRLAGSC